MEVANPMEDYINNQIICKYNFYLPCLKVLNEEIIHF